VIAGLSSSSSSSSSSSVVLTQKKKSPRVAVEKADGISTFSAVTYSDDSVTCWRSPEIGNGENFPLDKAERIYVAKCNGSAPQLAAVYYHAKSIASTTLYDPSARSLKSPALKERDTKREEVFSERRHIEEEVNDLLRPDSSHSKNFRNSIFTCPELGCIRVFSTANGLENHKNSGKHEVKKAVSGNK
jgi:hypothetical protein